MSMLQHPIQPTHLRAGVLRGMAQTAIASGARRAIHWGLCTSLAVLALGPAQVAAQSYPTKPIKFVIPFTAGGGTDVTARMLGEQLALKLGQSVIAENRPGASAGIAAGAVARERPDGYTLLVGTATLAANAVVPGANLQVDLINDFEPIAKIGQIDLILTVSAKSGIDRLSDLVLKMKAQPSVVQFGSPGIGAPAHLGGELFKQLTKADALHIPYKGESAALTDLIGGQTTFQLCAPAVCGPRILEGSLKGLAVTAKARTKVAPNVPTAAEAGVPGLEAGTWYYLAAPKGTPPAVVEKLNRAINEILADERFRARLLAMGVEVEPGTTPASVRDGLRAEMDKWRPVVKAAGVTIN
jgi:tripartite-type tricarboxylate transporter receptor subunit TctC